MVVGLGVVVVRLARLAPVGRGCVVGLLVVASLELVVAVGLLARLDDYDLRLGLEPVLLHVP